MSRSSTVDVAYSNVHHRVGGHRVDVVKPLGTWASLPGMPLLDAYCCRAPVSYSRYRANRDIALGPFCRTMRREPTTGGITHLLHPYWAGLPLTELFVLL